ncbi:MAG: hypothetical protein QOJ19_2321 [Acidimicrobiia bacterium]|jgi:DNA invertase Pin-like site-specific DNA recombinase|nr:hypothetical protein [Acidimicrobiia bacterium]
MRAVTYRRVSTEEQAVSGLGLEAQRTTLEAAIATRRWTVVADLADEGVSATLPPHKRPGLAQALELLCTRQADVLIVTKSDRLCRSVRDLLDLLDQAERCKFGVVALDSEVDTTTASGRLVATMVGAVAEWERRIIVERTRTALAAKKAAGARLGRPVQLSQELRRRVGELRATGLSIREVAGALNSEGRTQGNGAPWTRSAVQRVLRSLCLDGCHNDNMVAL